MSWVGRGQCFVRIPEPLVSLGAVIMWPVTAAGIAAYLVADFVIARR